MIARTVAMVGDFLVLAITWMKTIEVWKTSRELTQFKPKLSTLLLRDGTMYFAALTILNLVTLALDVVSHYRPDLDWAKCIVFATQCLGPLLISRFILDLRSAAAPERSTMSAMSTIHFSVHPALGNIAEPLGADLTWTTGAGVDDVQNIHAEREGEGVYFSN